MTACRTSIKLIEKAVSEKWSKQFAFYHLLKFRYNNSCIYNYRSRMDEIANEFNISTKTLYNYLNFLKSKELVCDHATNLKLKSIREFSTNRKKALLLINEAHDLFDVTCLLFAKLIERKAHLQAFAESARRYGRGDRFKRVLCESPFRPSLSYRTIAKLLNVSEFKAFEVMKNLNRLQIIESENQKPQKVSGNFTDLKSIADYPGYRYNIGSKLFEVFGARVHFLQFPVHLKKISSKQYLKFVSRDS
jgi:hypothetical protein